MLRNNDVPAQRAAVVREALAFLATPYHHMGRVKGVGVDCLTLIACAMENAGVIPPVGIPYYPKDWMHHRDAERYLEGLLRYAREVASPDPGDVALWKFGRCFSHAAVVVAWPAVVHACAGRNVCLEHADAAKWLSEIAPGKPRPVKFLSVWGA